MGPSLKPQLDPISVDPITEKNIEAIAEMEKKSILNRTLGERIAGRLTGVAGSVVFIMLHVAVFAVWIGLNLGLITSIPPWDPFPFSFLTLVHIFGKPVLCHQYQQR